MVLVILLLCLTNKTEATEKSMNKRVCDMKLSFRIWESFDFCNKIVSLNGNDFVELDDLANVHNVRLVINKTHFKWLLREKRFDLWKLAGKAYDMTIKSPAKIIKQVVYISKDVTDVVIKGMSITSKLIITFLSVVSISIMTLVACIYKCNLMHRIKNKIC